MTFDLSAPALLHLLQLASAALPVGAYSYSDGLETLVHQQRLTSAADLTDWICYDLTGGSSRLDGAILLRAYDAVQQTDFEGLGYWNQWLSASRDAEELRRQSWQMGRSLSRLLLTLSPETEPALHACEPDCNFAIAFAIAAAHWQIPREVALLGFLQSWATNLINSGVKLIPLGQTSGQQVLSNLTPPLIAAANALLQLKDDDLTSSSWGLSLATMQHETLYSRLFRS